MKSLFVSMTRREMRMGFCLFGTGVLLAVLLRFAGIGSFSSLLLLGSLLFSGVLLIFPRFLRESAQVPFTSFGSILKMALLGLIAAQLTTLLTNDLFYFFFPKYFFYDDTGPHFISAHKELLAAVWQQNGPVTLIFAVFLMPVVTEILHRGLIFGSLPFKSRTIACFVGTLIFAALRTCFLPGQQETAYIVISFLQYIPMGIFFTWIYSGTETILTPILAHILLNAVCIFTMR